MIFITLIGVLHRVYPNQYQSYLNIGSGKSKLVTNILYALEYVIIINFAI